MDFIAAILELAVRYAHLVGLIIALYWIWWFREEHEQLQKRVREVEDRQFNLFKLMVQKVTDIKPDDIREITGSHPAAPPRE